MKVEPEIFSLGNGSIASFLAAFFLMGALCPASEPPYPQWNGKESVAEYAKRAGLNPTDALDLGKVIKLDLVLVPAGTFTMGSPDSETGREPNEKPHKVTLTRPFYLGKCEVTQSQYLAVAGGEARVDTPITGKNWDEIAAWCKTASTLTKREVKLPTEAQWEFACRAGTVTRFHSGDTDTDLDKVGWYGGNSGRATHPVGQKAPNAWGLYDMHGNVREFVLDFWAGEYPLGDAVDPQGPTKGDMHTVRGGAFSSYPHICRSAMRLPQENISMVGFRVLVEAPPKK